MKPVLVVGLGNPLMGDDGVGWDVAVRLAADARLPEDVEVMPGGSDLLRLASSMEGRRRIVVIDAVQDSAAPGTVSVMGEEADDRQDHAHHLSAVQAIRLLRLTAPTPIILLGVSVESACLGEQLSPELTARMPEIVDRVLAELQNAWGY